MSLLTTSLIFAAREKRKGNTCKIIYLSRTHNQLEQVLNELKKLPFNAKSALFGSRMQLCPRKEIRTGGSRKCSKNCSDSIKAHGCVHFLNYQKNKSVLQKRYKYELMSLNEILTEIENQQICPFYFSKMFHQDADIILMPYFYLMSWKIRKIKKNILNNSIIIFDEAHNFIEQSEEGQNIDLSIEDFEAASEEMNNLFENFEFNLTNDEKYIINAIFFFINACLDYLKSNKLYNKHINKNDFGMAEVFHSFFEESIVYKLEYDRDEYEKSFIDKLNGKTQNPLSLLKHNGINFSGILKIFQNLKQIIFKYDQMNNKENSENKNPNKNTQIQNSIYYEILNLEGIIIRLNKIFQQSFYYINQFRYKTEFISDYYGNYFNTIRLVSLAAEETFQDIIESGVRSLVLTSGTLKPFEMFNKELKSEFKLTYDGDHVIKFSNQVIFK